MPLTTALSLVFSSIGLKTPRDDEDIGTVMTGNKAKEIRIKKIIPR